MSDALFTWAMGGSVGVHVAALSVAAAFGLWTVSAPAPAPVPIEVIQPTPEPPPPAPKPERISPPRRLVEPRARAPRPTPAQPSMLIDEKTALETPPPVAPAPEQRLPTNALVTDPQASIPGLREGGKAG